MKLSVPKKPLILQRTEIPELFSSISRQLSLEPEKHPPDTEELLSGFRQFLAIQEQLSRTDNLGSSGINPDEISELGEYGLTLLYQLTDVAETLEAPDSLQQIHAIVLSIADWIISKSGKIARPEPIVNALAAVTNTTRDSTELEIITHFMGRISRACSNSIKHDLDVSDPNRPWRLLHINRGIAATRSHNPELMVRVFEDLVAAIPYDAPDFFAEGMREMDNLDYPEHVRTVIEEYHERFSSPRYH